LIIVPDYTPPGWRCAAVRLGKPSRSLPGDVRERLAWLREQIALDEPAASVVDGVTLGGGLDSLGHDQ
jgi:hypothetical protein